ncbi:MAG: D-glutamate deacylase [Chloroflexi bacterium]|nr:D-glutamate deacylase [Chloroflexota bacterium]|tara:strand:+ start:6370 stop:7779 length:1410 start_codon:yes stop_codon:yes gene_type:complete
MVKKFQIVLLNGRIIDPESESDYVGNLGIDNGRIQYLGKESIKGDKEINISGLVIAPGFIDLHSHGQDRENYFLQASDGVTSALELELGTDDVNSWYEARSKMSPINYGVSIGHIPVRMVAMQDDAYVNIKGQEFKGDTVILPVGNAAYKEASPNDISLIKSMIANGLDQGAVCVGLGIAYTPGASWWEIIEVFRVAASFNAVCHVHMRGWGASPGNDAIQGLSELIAASSITGASLHLVHINSSGNVMVPKLLSMIKDASSKGLDITTECYPYAAGMTGIEAPLFDEGWQEKTGMDYKNLEWPETGERLNKEAFQKYRSKGGMVILHSMSQDVVDMAVESDITMIATDGYIKNGKGHPRTTGSYSMILGKYVREMKTLSLIEAIRKMSFMPAKRLEKLVPGMKNKGRIKIGADADLVIFNPDTIIDRSSYKHPSKKSEGIIHLIVNGKFVIENKKIDYSVNFGQAIRS